MPRKPPLSPTRYEALRLLNDELSLLDFTLECGCASECITLSAGANLRPRQATMASLRFAKQSTWRAMTCRLV
jgi:hypothetical protein